MPSTLRRPMFRGGPVKSEGTGITSGLDQGYADGGRVGFEGGGGALIPRPNLFSRVLSSAKYFNPFTEAGIGNIGRGIYNAIPGMTGGALRTGAGVVGTYPILSTLAVPAATIGGMAYLNRPRNEAELRFMQENDEITSKETTDPNLYEGYLMGRAAAREAGRKEGQPELGLFDVLSKGKETVQQPKSKSEVDILKEQMDVLRKAHAEELDKLRKDKTEPVTSEEGDITKWAKEARDLLGYDEAKRQSIYDAMLAASPGFFKGRTLREAAPNVIEAINKSGAFEKPTNIKQAAAQLAIQRKMMQEKAIAEEKTRYGYLEAKEGYKSKDPLERLKALGGDPLQIFEGKVPADSKLWKVGKVYIDSAGKLGIARKDEATKLVKIVPLE